MAVYYCEAVDDENFLTMVVLEKDFSGRDVLRIAMELEILELLQLHKIDAIIQRVYSSDYDQSGDIFKTSTSY